MGILPLPARETEGNTCDVDKYYMVDWVLPPTQLMDLRTAQRAIDEAGRRLTEEGHRVRCLHSTYVPAQRRWVCVFTASSAETIRKIHEIAQLPVPRVESALNLSLMDRLAS
ncbi:MAG: DUF4242 domain-containing protein [Actinophytocola sp.]|nr:DUF4242 domain-containing protein [Actinophytocola sp.]